MTESKLNQLIVSEVGLLAVVQDQGRFGYLDSGITLGGAVDGFAYRLGQRIVGNSLSAAAIEITLAGFRCCFSHDTSIAVTGADAPIAIDGQEKPMNTTLLVRSGSELTIGYSQRGVYSYLSIAGGVCSEPVLGSRSVVMRDGIGANLRPGDRVPYGDTGPCMSAYQYLAPARIQSQLNLRYIPGFQTEHISNAVVDAFHNTRFSVGNDRDRMGIRLSGPAVNTGVSTLWSESTCLGAIQIPPDGQPIVLLADRQTVGGYPKLGAVLSVDCARLSQASIGTPVKFTAVDPTEADRILWLVKNYEAELKLAKLRSSL